MSPQTSLGGLARVAKTQSAIWVERQSGLADWDYGIIPNAKGRAHCFPGRLSEIKNKKNPNKKEYKPLVCIATKSRGVPLQLKYARRFYARIAVL